MRRYVLLPAAVFALAACADSPNAPTALTKGVDPASPIRKAGLPPPPPADGSGDVSFSLSNDLVPQTAASTTSANQASANAQPSCVPASFINFPVTGQYFGNTQDKSAWINFSPLDNPPTLTGSGNGRVMQTAKNAPALDASGTLVVYQDGVKYVIHLLTAAGSPLLPTSPAGTVSETLTADVMACGIKFTGVFGSLNNFTWGPALPPPPP